MVRSFPGFWILIQVLWKLSCQLIVLEDRDCSHTLLLKLHSEHSAAYSLLNVRLWRTADFFFDSYMHSADFRKAFTVTGICCNSSVFALKSVKHV